jgi:hypothetical protein
VVCATWGLVRAEESRRRAEAARDAEMLEHQEAVVQRNNALAAERQITKENERAEKALADATSEREKAERYLVRSLQKDTLFNAMDMELKGEYEMAERVYLSGREELQNWPGARYGDTTAVTAALCRFYGRRNTPEKGEPLLRELLALYKQHPEAKPEAQDDALLSILGPLGLNLLEQHKWADAEKVLRECLAVCDRLDKWIRQESRGRLRWSVGWTTRSMLGQSLVGQKKYAEAEPYLMEGYNVGKALFDALGDVDLRRVSIKETVERLVQLYEAWDKPDKAAKWRKELEAFKKSAPKSGAP